MAYVVVGVAVAAAATVSVAAIGAVAAWTNENTLKNNGGDMQAVAALTLESYKRDAIDLLTSQGGEFGDYSAFVELIAAVNLQIYNYEDGIAKVDQYIDQYNNIVGASLVVVQTLVVPH